MALKDMTIFFVSFSRGWGTIERTILKDCLLAREAGASVFLYCLKNSYLSFYAEEAGLECLHHKGGVKAKWHKMRKLSKAMQKLKVNLVHCYEIKILWILAFFLRAKPLVPLIFTPAHEFKKLYRHFYYRPLMSRVDQVFLLNAEMMENMWRHLGIPPRKIDFIGLGLEVSNREESELASPFRESDDWRLGANMAGMEGGMESLETLLEALQVLAQKSGGKGYQLILAAERPCLPETQESFLGEVKKRVDDRGLGEYVTLANPCQMGEIQRQVDLWIGLERPEDLEDYGVEAALNGVPVLLPRNALSMELNTSMGLIGESYRPSDSRELRKKCEKILLNLETYRGNLHRSHQRLRDQYGKKSYGEGLLGLYRKLRERRQRLFHQKLKGLALPASKTGHPKKS